MTSPGRLEVVRRSPTVLVDAAHNPHGARSLVAALEEAFTFTRLVGLVGIVADKDAVGMLEVLEPALDHVVITRSSSPAGDGSRSARRARRPRSSASPASRSCATYPTRSSRP